MCKILHVQYKNCDTVYEALGEGKGFWLVMMSMIRSTKCMVTMADNGGGNSTTMYYLGTYLPYV